MSFRIALPVRLKAVGVNGSFGAQSRFASTVAQRKRKHQHPYAAAQARARKAAHISRQSVIQAERAIALGDPVRGISTPFLESFDTTLPPASSTDGSVTQPPTTHSNTASSSESSPFPSNLLNYFVSATALNSSLDQSHRLSKPYVSENPLLREQDPDKRIQAEQSHQTESENASEALKRIVAVENTSSRDRKHLNIQRCIETFGRHNTDKYLRPRPTIVQAMKDAGIETEIDGGRLVLQETIDRAGLDTGSSEVQIGILTAKIRTLATFLEGPGRKDKVNKRNLRLLVHRRQKLLRYLRKKERGGERWQHLIQTLGLTEGTWKGEISL